MQIPPDSKLNSLVLAMSDNAILRVHQDGSVLEVLSNGLAPGGQQLVAVGSVGHSLRELFPASDLLSEYAKVFASHAPPCHVFDLSIPSTGSHYHFRVTPFVEGGTEAFVIVSDISNRVRNRSLRAPFHSPTHELRVCLSHCILTPLQLGLFRREVRRRSETLLFKCLPELIAVRLRNNPGISREGDTPQTRSSIALLPFSDEPGVQVVCSCSLFLRRKNC